jgi:hypothetical protein
MAPAKAKLLDEVRGFMRTSEQPAHRGNCEWVKRFVFPRVPYSVNRLGLANRARRKVSAQRCEERGRGGPRERNAGWMKRASDREDAVSATRA